MKPLTIASQVAQRKLQWIAKLQEPAGLCLITLEAISPPFPLVIQHND